MQLGDLPLEDKMIRNNATWNMTKKGIQKEGKNLEIPTNHEQDLLMHSPDPNILVQGLATKTEAVNSI